MYMISKIFKKIKLLPEGTAILDKLSFKIFSFKTWKFSRSCFDFSNLLIASTSCAEFMGFNK